MLEECLEAAPTRVYTIWVTTNKRLQELVCDIRIYIDLLEQIRFTDLGVNDLFFQVSQFC